MRNPLVKISKAVLMTAAALIPALGVPGPLPEGATVTGGQGSITQSGALMTINQASHTFSVDWQSFSIGAGNTVRFVQPSSTASALNRVVGGNPSEILGNITANGRVFLVNPAGITFAAGSSVNVGSLVASTLDISTDKFHAGDFVFEGDSRSAITNLGNIQTATGGSVALIAAKIENQGQISAERGSVAMGAGSRVRLNFGGLALLEVETAAVDAAIEQGGGVRADGGSVLLTARAANKLASAVVNHTGVIEARSLSVDAKGSIILDGGDGSVVAIGKTDASGSASVDGGSVAVSGGFTSLGGTISADGAKGGSVVASGIGTLSLADTVSAKGLATDGGAIAYSSGNRIIEIGGSNTDASGARNGGTITVTAVNRLASSGIYLANGVAGNGGRIDLTAADLRLLSAKLDASGGLDGGLVRLGGAFQGGKTPDTSASYYDSFLGRWGSLAPIANAGQTFVNDATTIKVSGTNGVGGTSVVWSDVQTTFLGGIDARGKVAGGSAEISSAGTLRQASLVNVQLGNGQLLLDPKDITIGDAATVSNWSYAGIMGLFYADVSVSPNGLSYNDNFGSAVSLNAMGDRLAVGAVRDSGVVDLAGDAGAVYLFSFTDTSFAGGVLLGTVGLGYSGGKNVNVAALEAGDGFGAAVSLNATGDRLAVGAYADDGSGNSVADSGAVYLFSFTDTSFTGGALLGTIGKGYSTGKSFNATALGVGDAFGSSVSLNALGNRLAVGAPGDDGSGNSVADSGAVYLFSFTDTSFTGGALLGTIGKSYSTGKNVNNTALENSDAFGSSVSLNASGNRLAVGAPGDDGAGNLATNASGAVYLYNFTDTSFTGGSLQGTIGVGYSGGKNINPAALEAGDCFGNAVSLNAAGDRLAVGACFDDGLGNVANWSGAVYLFTFTDTSFSGGSFVGMIGKGYTGTGNINMPDLAVGGYGFGNYFGSSVSLNAAGDRLAVGAQRDGGAYDLFGDSGAVYLFAFQDTSLSRGALLGAMGVGFYGEKNVNVSNLKVNHGFGGSVSLNAIGDRLAVGAPFDGGSGNLALNSGAVYLFNFKDASFTGGSLEGTIGKGYTGGKNINVAALDAGDYFGMSVSLNAAGSRLAVGASGDSGTGNVATGSGAAYLFSFSDTSFTGGSLQGTIGLGYAGGKNVSLNALEASDAFGRSVSLNATGDRLAVGAAGDSGPSNLSASSGAAYLFSFTDGSFAGGALQCTIGKGYTGGNNIDLSDLQPGDNFGSSVSLNATGNRLAIGAVGNDGYNRNYGNSGAVYLFGFTDSSFAGGTLYRTIGRGYNINNTNLEANDHFGASVSLNAAGDRLAVGAPWDDGNFNYVSNSGAVHLFRFTDASFTGGQAWGLINNAYGPRLGLEIGDNFGSSVSLNAAGDRLAVGAYGDAGAGNVASLSGAVYLLGFTDTSFGGRMLFGRMGKGYTAGKDVNVASLGQYEFFGQSLSFNALGDRLAVGAPGDSGFGDVANASGAVYLFGFSGSSFSGGSLLATIGKGYAGGNNYNLATLEAGDAFGISVALNAAGDRLAVGAYGDDGFANNASYSGAVCLFKFTNTSFSGGSLIGTIGYGYSGGNDVNLTQLEAGDMFGCSVSLNASGKLLVVGAEQDAGAGNLYPSSGAAYMFGFTDTAFTGGAHLGTIGRGYGGLKGFDIWSLEYDYFGSAVSLNAVGDRLAVGARNDGGYNNAATQSGAVYLLGFSDDSFSSGQILGVIGKNYSGGKNVNLSQLESADFFGTSVSLNAAGDLLAVGAAHDDGAGNAAYSSGAVYLFSFYDNAFSGGELRSTIGKGYSGSKDLDLSPLGVGDSFGCAVALNAVGNRLAVGAYNDDARGDVATGSGAVYLFAATAETGPYPASVGSIFGSRSEQSVTVWASDLVSQLKAGTSVTLQASNDIRLSTILNVVPTGAAGGNLTLQAGRSVYLDYAVTTGNGNLTLIGNDLLANGVVDQYRVSGSAVIAAQAIDVGTGTLTIDLRNGAGKTYAAASLINLTGAIAAGALNITSAAPFGYMSGDVYLPAVVVSGNLNVNAIGPILAYSPLSVGGTTSVTNSSASPVFLTSSGNSLIGTVTASVGRELSIVNSGLLTLGTIHAADAISVSTLSGNLTLNGALDSSKVAADAVTLNAGSGVAAGTASGGDIILGTGSITVLSGARATLYTGSLAGSTALATSVGSGSGRFRYGSDETTSAFTTALSTGKYLIYREQPALSFTVDSKSITYGQSLPTLTGTITSGALRNGDAAAYSAVGASNSAAGFIRANTYTINAAPLSALGYGVTTTTGTLTVAKKTLTVSGLSASNKTYDADLGATVTGTAAITSGATTSADGLYYGTDTVSLSGSATGTFGTKTAATGKTVTVSGLTLAGADSANYQLGALSLTADIAKKTLTVSGLSASNKTYDAALGATLTGTAALTSGAVTSSDGLYYGTDTVSVTGSATGAFGTKDAATGKTVTVSGLTLAGADSANYQLSAISLSADIAQRAIGVRANDRSKVEGASDPALTYSVASGSLAGSDAFAGSLTRASGEAIGSYQISVGTLSAGANYLTTFTPGSFSILAASSGIPDVSLFTNPLWRIRLGDGFEEEVARRPRIVWPPNTVRSERLPSVKGANRGPDIIIRTTPISRVETISK